MILFLAAEGVQIAVHRPCGHPTHFRPAPVTTVQALEAQAAELAAEPCARGAESRSTPTTEIP